MSGRWRSVRAAPNRPVLHAPGMVPTHARRRADRRISHPALRQPQVISAAADGSPVGFMAAQSQFLPSLRRRSRQRPQDALALIAEGRSNAAIASAFTISPGVLPPRALRVMREPGWA